MPPRDEDAEDGTRDAAGEHADELLLDRLIVLTDQLLARAVADPIGGGERVEAIAAIRAISIDPLLLARAAGHYLGAFLSDPVSYGTGVQGAALLDAAGADRAAQAVVVEAINVRTRLARPRRAEDSTMTIIRGSGRRRGVVPPKFGPAPPQPRSRSRGSD